MAIYLKLSITGVISGTSTFEAIQLIQVYDSKNNLISLNNTNVIEHNYINRKTASDIDKWFVPSDGGIPYDTPNNEGIIVLKLPEAVLSINKISLKSYVNTGGGKNVSVFYSRDSISYKSLGLIVFSTINEIKEVDATSIKLNKFLISSNLNTDLISLFKKGNIQNLVPTMTSNATSGVTVSASSISSGYDAYLAFNGQADGGWQTNNTRTGWLKIDFGKPQTIRKFSITASTNAGSDRAPKIWTLQGSNTGSFTGEETVLFTGNESRWTSGETKEYVLSTFFTFRYYRLNITDVIGALNYANIGELRFFEIEKQEKGVNILDSIEEVDFIKYGMEKNYEIVLSDNYSNKSFIKKSNTTLGSGKVFKQKINTTETPIKKASIT
ncbi:discoidin domain-containing protein [Paenibacillus sp. FSL K6-1122]|uniref:discoidin domain-containing protein n=1 Tax=Paenibacillus sp. FSL K6-1122 TaxID=2954512 RepID=UPI0030EBE2FC